MALAGHVAGRQVARRRRPGLLCRVLGRGSPWHWRAPVLRCAGHVRPSALERMAGRLRPGAVRRPGPLAVSAGEDRLGTGGPWCCARAGHVRPSAPERMAGCLRPGAVAQDPWWCPRARIALALATIVDGTVWRCSPRRAGSATVRARRARSGSSAAGWCWARRLAAAGSPPAERRQLAGR